MFWIWNVDEHRKDFLTNGDCCFNHIIGLPQKNGNDKALYDYERIIFDTLVIQDMSLKPFQKLVNLIKQSKTGYIAKQELLKYDYSSSSLSSSSGDDADGNNHSCDFANNFDKIIGWGRMALLIDYNSDTEIIRLRGDNVVVDY